MFPAFPGFIILEVIFLTLVLFVSLSSGWGIDKSTPLCYLGLGGDRR